MSDETTATEAAVETEENAQQVPPTETGESAKDSGPDAGAIPKGRLDAEIAKRREMEKELEAFRQKQTEEEEAAAKAAGDIDRFQSENKALRDRVKAYEERETARLEGVVSGLSDEDKAIIEELGDVSLEKRVALAEKLAARDNKTVAPGFGTNGGKAKETAGKIPPSVTTPAEYTRWMATLNGTAEGRALLADKDAWIAIREEAKRKKLR